MASVSGIKEIKNGGIIIKGKSNEDLEKIKKLSEKELNEKYTVSVSKLKLPRLVLIGPKKMYTNIELLKEMQALNYLDENDTISIKYTRKSKYSSRYIIYIETKGETFRKLVDKDIALGWDRCKIREDFNIMICFKCCGYGHKKEDCKKKDPVCSFCTGKHDYWECKQEFPKCCNCINYNKLYHQKNDYNHEANKNDCTLHKLKIKQSKEKINYN